MNWRTVGQSLGPHGLPQRAQILRRNPEVCRPLFLGCVQEELSLLKQFTESSFADHKSAGSAVAQSAWVILGAVCNRQSLLYSDVDKATKLV